MVINIMFTHPRLYVGSLKSNTCIERYVSFINNELSLDAEEFKNIFLIYFRELINQHVKQRSLAVRYI